MHHVRFVIEVEMPDDESTAQVRISSSGPHLLAAQMVAVEHMMTMFAVSSDAGFDRALELLCEGARENHVKHLGGPPSDLPDA